MTLTDVLLILVIIGIGYLAWRPRSSTEQDSSLKEEVLRLRTDVKQRNQEVGELQQSLSNATAEKDELSGKNKQLFVQVTALKEENKSLSQDKAECSTEIAKYKAEEKQNTTRLAEEISALHAAKSSFHDEQKRIREEDERSKKIKEEQRDRMWAEHENNVKATLTELCRMSEYSFPFHDNKNLPDDFGGKLKPDFMLEFLDQYVIFDAKVSKSEKLQTYVSTNVKTTVEKINGHPKVYKTLFFIVPTDAMGSLTKTRFYEQGYEFFIVSPESIPVIFSAFKKIAAYELAEQMDPQDRENIVSLIAEFDNHIRFRNAVDILVAESGRNVLTKTDQVGGEMRAELADKRSKMRTPQFAPTEVKTLMISADAQESRIKNLIDPEAPVSKREISAAKKLFSEE